MSVKKSSFLSMQTKHYETLLEILILFYKSNGPRNQNTDSQRSLKIKKILGHFSRYQDTYSMGDMANNFLGKLLVSQNIKNLNLHFTIHFLSCRVD